MLKYFNDLFSEVFMLNIRINEGIRKLIFRFKDIGKDNLNNFTNFCALASLFLLGKDNLSATVRACPWSNSVSELSRAIKGFDGNRFMRRMRTSILRKYKGKLNLENFIFVLDDTDNPKYGDGIYRKGKWKGTKGIYNGQKILVLAIVDIRNGFAIPLSYQVMANKNKPEYKSTIDCSIELLENAMASGFPKLHVVTDSWFDGAEFMQRVTDMGLVYAGEIKSNRNVRGNPGKNVKWIKLKPLFKNLERHRVVVNKLKPKWFSERILYITKFKSPLKSIAVYNRKNGVNAFAYYATTDLSMSGAKLWSLSRARWKIECLFRDIKQNLSFGKLPCSGKESTDLAICLPFALYTSLRLDDPKMWNLDKKESIGKMVGKIRQMSYEKSLKFLIEKRGDHELIEIARNRMSNLKVNEKPVDRVEIQKAG